MQQTNKQKQEYFISENQNNNFWANSLVWCCMADVTFQVLPYCLVLTDSWLSTQSWKAILLVCMPVGYSKAESSLCDGLASDWDDFDSC